MKGRLPSKVIFHHRLSFIKVRLPSNQFFQGDPYQILHVLFRNPGVLIFPLPPIIMGKDVWKIWNNMVKMLGFWKFSKYQEANMQ